MDHHEHCHPYYQWPYLCMHIHQVLANGLCIITMHQTHCKEVQERLSPWHPYEVSRTVDTMITCRECLVTHRCNDGLRSRVYRQENSPIAGASSTNVSVAGGQLSFGKNLNQCWLLISEIKWLYHLVCHKDLMNKMSKNVMLNLSFPIPASFFMWINQS